MPEPRIKRLCGNSLRAFLIFGAKIYLTTATRKLQRIAAFNHLMSFYLLNGLRGLTLEHLRQVQALSMGRSLVSSDIC